MIKKSAILFFCAIIVMMPLLCNGSSVYNGFGGYIIGDQRLIGLAGAYLAKSADLNAMNYNPAGLVFSPSIAMAGIYQGKIDNSSTDYDKNGSKDSFPLSYWSGGIVGRTNRPSLVNIAMGLGYNTPYAAEQDFGGKVLPSTVLEKYNLRLAVNAFVIPVALQLASNLSVGLNCNLYSVEEKIVMKFPVYYPGTSTVLESVDINDEQKASGTGVDLGLLYLPTPSSALGVVIKPPKTFSFEEKKFYGKLTGANTGIQWYRNVKIPLRIGVGFLYQFLPSFGVEVDANYIGAQKDTVLVGSNLVGGIENYEFKNKGVWDLHVGGNRLIRFKEDLTLDLRAGTYYEPSRVTLLSSRWHYTGGFQLNISRIIFGLGYDTAKDYSNLVTVLALVLRK